MKDELCQYILAELLTQLTDTGTSFEHLDDLKFLTKCAHIKCTKELSLTAATTTAEKLHWSALAYQAARDASPFVPPDSSGDGSPQRSTRSRARLLMPPNPTPMEDLDAQFENRFSMDDNVDY